MSAGAGPLIRVNSRTWVRAGHVSGVRFMRAITGNSGHVTNQAELEIEMVTGSIYRLHGEDAEREYAALEDGSSNL